MHTSAFLCLEPACTQSFFSCREPACVQSFSRVLSPLARRANGWKHALSPRVYNRFPHPSGRGCLSFKENPSSFMVPGAPRGLVTHFMRSPTTDVLPNVAFRFRAGSWDAAIRTRPTMSFERTDGMHRTGGTTRFITRIAVPVVPQLQTKMQMQIRMKTSRTWREDCECNST